MLTCSGCGTTSGQNARFCLVCGRALEPVTDGTSLATVAIDSVEPAGNTRSLTGATRPGIIRPALPVSASSGIVTGSGAVSGEGRFPPGTLLAGRYRISSMLGKGGMGEVYRAVDLALDQQVALKFLPEALSANTAMIARFYGEVRTARRVSHANVCRVYDIGEIEGTHYLSMEYVDGEDLGSLLRRIGRLPVDKANEIARKLCAGLAAAHEKGILHRDLKPANVMLDSKGQVFIMDFGLAAVAAEIVGAEVRNGTPAYMAPEQLAGSEVSIRSDIYALGLLLYELYTGKRPFPAGSAAELIRLQQQANPVRPSEIVPGLDPAVERTLDWCLNPDPAARPASALQVSASLPGGNPLAEALAAGETPSPEMVAASGSVEGMPPLRAAACLAASLIGVIAAAWLIGTAYGPVLATVELSPDVLIHRARQIEGQLGYDSKLPGTAWNFAWNTPYIERLKALKTPLPPLQRGPDQALNFWLRESPKPIVVENIETQSLAWSQPSFDTPGGRRIRIDSQGDLMEFEAIPQPNTMEMNEPPPDWEEVLRIGGFHPEAFSASPPIWTPTQPFDSRMAWTGSCPNFQPDLRIEAAAWKGKVVWFRVIPKWEKPAAMEAAEANRLQVAIQILLYVVLLIAASFMAWSNFKSNRGDRRGALRTATAALILGVASWILGVRHVAASEEFSVIVSGVEISMLFAAILWAMYLAVEPRLRRHWPGTLVTWTRVLAGNVRDPLVASDVLLGVMFGIAWASVYAIRVLLLNQMKLTVQPRLDTDTLMGFRFALADIVGFPLNTFRQLFLTVVLMVVFRMILKRNWLASVATILVFAAQNSPATHVLALDLFYAALMIGIFVVLITRMGVLCAAVAFSVSNLLSYLPVTLDMNAWYSSSSLTAMATVAIISLWAFRTTLAGRPLLQSGPNQRLG